MKYRQVLIVFVYILTSNLLASVELVPVGLREPLSIESVYAFLKAHPEIRTVDDLIPLLPESFRLRRVFAFNSRSLQAASPSHPRIIMHSEDGSFVLAATGQRSGRGSSEIEMMQFKAGQTMAFQFASYSFEEEQHTHRRVGFSGINPSQCLDCHQRQGVIRPFWEPYNTWIGFYGQENHTPFTGREKEHFTQFLKTLKKAPGRYASLFRNPSEVDADTVLNADEYRPGIANAQQLRDQRRDDGTNLRRLNTGFNYFNFMRIHQELRKKSFYPQLKYALLASLIRCYHTHEIDSFIPAELRDQMARRGRSFEDVTRDSRRSASALLDARRARASRLEMSSVLRNRLNEDNWARFGNDEEVFRDARYLMMTQNEDILDWFMTREQQIGFLSVDKDDTTRFLPYFILQDILTEYPELRSSFRIENFTRGQTRFYTAMPIPDNNRSIRAICETLKTASLRAFARPVPQPRRSSEPGQHNDGD